DQKPEERDEFLADDDPLLAAFPYVNGGLFADEDIVVPPFTDEIRELLLTKASSDFDWSSISPTIFGAVFESTLNPETRRSGGMHYTSIENIHKVIDPLFLDDLKAELEEISAIPIEKTRVRKLKEYQAKLASLDFLDPAAGSGNFLTESYLCLRRLENDVLRLLSDQMSFGESMLNPIQVSIAQFHGIEINDFAVTVAKTALWIAESQMMKETEDIIYSHLDFLPLKTNANIVEGNALRIDWNDVVPKEKLDYIMGNPPFVGHNVRNNIQKYDMEYVFGNIKTDKIDYVSCWFYKAASFTQNTSIRTAFVATNSICQGVSIGILWKQVFSLGHKIDFAWTTFIWNSEASDKAHVHVVIVGFSDCKLNRNPRLFRNGLLQKCENINGYLIDAPDICIERRSDPLSDIPKIRVGSLPRSSAFTVTSEERPIFISDNPICEKWIKPYIGSDEFINGKERYCLWLKDANIKEVRSCKLVMERIAKVREDRLASPAATTRRTADTPMLFAVDAQPDTNYLIIPQVSSERRRYIPIGFMSPDVIASNLVFVVPNATLYHFGILTSNVHNAWMRLTCGRMKSDYRYGGDLVYNNFPWPDPTEEQRRRIEQTAQAILDARALYPESSLADLYDELTMPPELRTAHQQNDRAVMQAYGFPIKDFTESDCVAELMKLYKKMTETP
ncbi:MAG: class I SAM-dependent DNA methyltransferase, partial [Clostridia bacterium]|nr:class I SAM-dependent DNA methyltransferase [Clostridia bacterium]